MLGGTVCGCLLATDAGKPVLCFFLCLFMYFFFLVLRHWTQFCQFFFDVPFWSVAFALCCCCRCCCACSCCGLFFCVFFCCYLWVNFIICCWYMPFIRFCVWHGEKWDSCDSERPLYVSLSHSLSHSLSLLRWELIDGSLCFHLSRLTFIFIHHSLFFFVLAAKWAWLRFAGRFIGGDIDRYRLRWLLHVSAITMRCGIRECEYCDQWQVQHSTKSQRFIGEYP